MKKCILALSVFVCSLSQTYAKSLLDQNQSSLLTSLRCSKEYEMSFPFFDYKICAVPKLGKFYIDTSEDVIKAVLSRGDIWEADYIALLKKYAKPRTIVLDIGSHIGTHTLTLSKAVGLTGVVIAFEPQKKIWRELVMNVSLNKRKNVMPVWAALGEKNAHVTLGPVIEGNEGHRSIGEGEDVVTMLTLDSLNLQRVSFIKMDVEGFEDEVFSGARKTILRNRPVIFFEIQGGEPANEEEKKIKEERSRETIARVRQLGYRVQKVHHDDYLAIPRMKR